MGCCCSCDKSEDGPSERDLELKAKSLAISRNMTSPSVEIDRTGAVSGEGLALAGVQIEQDAAYWEWHVKLPPKTHCDTVLFGVSSKKNRDFYGELKDKTPVEEGTWSENRLLVCLEEAFQLPQQYNVPLRQNRCIVRTQWNQMDAEGRGREWRCGWRSGATI
eukprot:scaffold2816_cov121-Cylindrotheca_fusiformis.AAC.13